jgi:hypothetical protein
MLANSSSLVDHHQHPGGGVPGGNTANLFEIKKRSIDFF